MKKKKPAAKKATAKQPAKSGAKKAPAPKPAAKKSTGTSAPAPAAAPRETYTPQPVTGIGWAPFRYPPQ